MSEQQQRPMSIYLAGPIEGISTEDAMDWRQQVANLAPTGCLLFNPVTAWHGVSSITASAVAYGDRVVIAACDGVLANLSGPGRGFGTVREIEFARNQGKPVAVCAGDTPLISCFAHDVFQEPTLEASLMALIEAIRERQDAPPPGMMLLRLPGFGVDGGEEGDRIDEQMHRAGGAPRESTESLIPSLREKADLLHGRSDCTFEDEAAANLMRAAATEIEAQAMELRAFELVLYANALPDGVTTEAFAEAANLRREAANLRG